MNETIKRLRTSHSFARGCVFLAPVLLVAVGASQVAAQSPAPIVLSLAKLRLDTSTKGDNGRLSVKALLDDNDTVGMPGEEFATNVLADQATLTVTDGGAFNATVALTGCNSKSGNPLNPVKISCRSVDRNVRAQIVPTRQGPLIFNLRVAVRKLPDSVTGGVVPSGPVTVVVHQTPSIDRPDEIGECQARGTATLICRER